MMKWRVFLLLGSLVVVFLLLGLPSLLNKKSNPPLVDEWPRWIRQYLKMPLDEHYGSHALVLLAALFVCRTGPMLELGMGMSSTTLLSRFSLEQRRRLLSADSDLRWINYFSSLAKNNSYQRFQHVEVKSEMGMEWAMSNLEDAENWTLVFIDHRPGARRQFDLMSYAFRSELVIIHDTEKSGLYQYEQGLKYYPHRYRFTRLKTFTDALSTRNASLIESIRRLLESTPSTFFANQTRELPATRVSFPK